MNTKAENRKNGALVDDLPRRRAAIRGDILRTNTAVVVILVAVLSLAFVAVLAGLRAQQQQERAEQAERDAEQRLWNSYLAQAQATRLTGRMGRKKAALEAVQQATALRSSVELRSEAIAALVLTDLETDPAFFPHSVDTSYFSIDAERNRYAVVENSPVIRVMRMSDRAELGVLDSRAVTPQASTNIQSIRFSRDGRFLATRYAGGGVIVWNMEDKAPVLTAGLTNRNRTLGGIVFSPDSRTVSFANAERDGELCVMDLKTGAELDHGIKLSARLFRFHPETNLLAVAVDTNVELWDYATKQKLDTLPHVGRVFIVSWAPDGKHLVSTCQNGDVYYWDLRQRSYQLLSGHTEPCLSASFSADGNLLATGSRDGTTRVWDLLEFRLLAEARDGMSLGFDGAGGKLLYWKRESGFGLWRVVRSDCLQTFPCDPAQGELLTFDLSANGRWCLATQNKGFVLWETSGKGLSKFVSLPDLNSARFGPGDDHLLICRSSGLEKWPLPVAASSNLELAPATRIPLPDGKSPRSITVAQDGRTAAVELSDLSTVILDLKEERVLQSMNGTVSAPFIKGPAGLTGAGRYALSPDGRWLAHGVGFGLRPRVWDARTGERVSDLACATGTVCFTPDGKLLVVAGLDYYASFSVGDWREVNRIERGGNTFTHGSVAFSRTEPLMAIVHGRQQMRLLDSNTGELIADLEPPNRQSINSLRMALDGSILACATASDFMRVWDLKKLRERLAPLGLDWGQMTSAPSANKASQRRFLSPLLMGLLVGLAALSAGVILLRTRHLLKEYAATEELSESRRRELEHASVALMHSQKMRALGTLAAGIAHDFNNLLSVIRMSNKLIGRRCTTDPEVSEYVTDVEQAVIQGKNVVRSMLGYARQETLDERPVLVEEVIENTVSLLSKEFLSGIILTLEVSHGTPPVKMLRGRLEQILLNLVVNASEAMQGNGRLQITARARTTMPDIPLVLTPATASQYVELTVADSGPGIPPAIIGRIFEPFFTTKNNMAKPGTGLGLSLVYSIAEQDGAGLGVQSRTGAGTAFMVVVPAGDQTAPVRQTHSAAVHK